VSLTATVLPAAAFFALFFSLVSAIGSSVAAPANRFCCPDVVIGCSRSRWLAWMVATVSFCAPGMQPAAHGQTACWYARSFRGRRGLRRLLGSQVQARTLTSPGRRILASGYVWRKAQTVAVGWLHGIVARMREPQAHEGQLVLAPTAGAIAFGQDWRANDRLTRR